MPEHLQLPSFPPGTPGSHPHRAARSLAAHREVDSSRNQEEHGSHGERQGSVFGQEPRCQSKPCTRVKVAHARRNLPEGRPKPPGCGAEVGAEQADGASEGDRLSDGYRAVRGFGGFVSRATLSEPPDTAGIGDDRTCAHFLASALNRSRDGGDIGADSACRNMRAQPGISPLGPAGLEDGSQNFRFEFTLDWCHRLPPSGPPNKAANLRRARNNMVFRLAGLRSSTAAISLCEAPSA